MKSHYFATFWGQNYGGKLLGGKLPGENMGCKNLGGKLPGPLVYNRIKDRMTGIKPELCFVKQLCAVK